MLPSNEHPRAKELECISHILDANPNICEMAIQDLSKGKKTKSQAGANGMTADQVVRAAIIKQLFNLPYEELAFQIIDSNSIRRFMRIGIADKGFKKSVLCKNIKALSSETWEAINVHLIRYAKMEDIEKGRKVRIDCTVVESNIHEPSDSSLLFDSIRVVTRLLHKAVDDCGLKYFFQDNTRRGKKRLIAIQYGKTKDARKQNYIDLIKITRNAIRFARGAVDKIDMTPSFDLELFTIQMELRHYIDLAERVIDQTERRVILEQSVPASEKIVSIFETHTDIIIKDKRDTHYGHKICLTGGPSNLILDCFIVDGNPADSTLTQIMLDRQKNLYGNYPLKAAFDGGFASKDNVAKAKKKEIKDVCFAKKRGLQVEDMCRSQWVYNRLRRFRAGIESGISWVKRCFGLTRCTWKGLRSFKSYVWASIVSANLLTMARKQIA